MQDPRCPNCRYSLVLLDRRMKYKCAKCGKLFPQKDIEDQNFREWNNSQRLLDKTTLRKPRIKLTEEERKERAKASSNRWRENNMGVVLEKQRERYWKNHEKEIERCRIYRENNKDKRSLTNKAWLEMNKENRKQWLKSYLEENRDKVLSKKRIGFWRAKQKALALRMLENMEEKGCNYDIFNSPPTSYFTNY